MGKFKINLQIQPFDFEISCLKYQNYLSGVLRLILPVQGVEKEKVTWKKKENRDFSAFFLLSKIFSRSLTSCRADSGADCFLSWLKIFWSYSKKTSKIYIDLKHFFLKSVPDCDVVYVQILLFYFSFLHCANKSSPANIFCEHRASVRNVKINN